MQVDDGAMAMVAQSLDEETEGLDGALLPVHVPDASRQAAPGEADGVMSDDVRALLAAIRRLESVVEEETAALETGRRIDFDEFSARKSRSMLEFVRLMRGRVNLGNESQIREDIRRLRRKLERNRTILEMHYDAVREVATIIVRAIKEAESDGTYSANAMQDGK
jgi:flagellar biosynthesis/type III secretory pathway chaperone